MIDERAVRPIAPLPASAVAPDAPAAAVREPGLLAGIWDFRIKKSVLKLSARLRAAVQGRLASPPYVRSRYGVLLRANWRDRTFQYCFYGTYGWALVDLLNEVDRPFCFLDIGANQGLYSLIAGRLPRCAHVIALEPVRDTFLLLQDNIAANGEDGRIAPIEAALSDRTGLATISTNPAHSGTASLEHAATGQDASGDGVRLMDHAELDGLIPPEMPLVIKVDVEGHEGVVIRELLKSRHAGAIAHLFYEIDRRWTDGDEIVALLRSAGFTRFRKFGVGRHYDMLASR